MDELLLEFDELCELAFENAAPPNDEWLLLLLELFRERLDDRLIEVLVGVLPRDIVPMKSIGPEATCTPELKPSRLGWAKLSSPTPITG